MTSLQNGWAIAEYLEKFSGLDASVANKLIGAGQGYAVASNLEKFNNLNHNDIADRLIGTRQGRYVAQYLEKFSGLDVKTAVKLYRDGTNLETLKQHPQSFNFDINQIEQLMSEPE